MSKTIDQRVVEMRFDNKQFESNAQASIRTLDKLKEKLNLSGAAKGLEDINAAASKVNMSGMGSAIDTVRTKFSALEVVAVTALVNIANQAVNAGKRLVSSLTIEPIMDGFREYELTLNAVQTTMAGTGKTAREVEEELKRLDEYADKTVYSTADMLNNLPKFTNAGVELEKATTAMIGIANATALAGGDAQKASIAFYNLGQAIGTGYLTRMDYNSINNAGIATMEWKNQMVEAALAADTLTKAGDDLYKAGNKTFTLQQLFIDGLKEQWATTDVMMKVFEDYGNVETEIGEKAQAAAQDIKTFTQMMESLKATAGTGWKDTWQLIFGDLDAAKQFWTGLSNVISGVITRMADWRNALVKSALGKGFSELSDKVKGLVKPLSKMSDTMKTATDAVKDYKKVVKEIIAGDWGNGQKRWDALTKAGYDWAHAQNLVNEELGCSVRHTTKYSEAQAKGAKTTKELTNSEAKHIAKLAELSDAELKALGYTDKQIEAFRELKAAAEKIGLPLDEFISKIDEIDGRWLFINSFKNIGDAFSQVAEVIKQAWTDIFPNTSDKIANGIFNIITAFHKFTTSLGGFVDESGKLTESGEKLKITFEGIFAALDLFLTVTSGPLGIAFRVLRELLEALDIPILDITLAIANVIIKFRDWLDSILNFSGVFEKLIPYIENAIDAIRNFFDSFKDSKFVEVGTNIVKGFADGIKNGATTVWEATKKVCSGIVDTFKNFDWSKISTIFEKIAPYVDKAADAIRKFVDTIKNSKFVEVGKNIVVGLANGIRDGAIVVWNAIENLAKTILAKIKAVLGIHSPSTETYEIGSNLIQGLVNGIKNGSGIVWEGIRSLCKKMIEVFKNFDWSMISDALWVVGSFFPSVKILPILRACANFAKNAGDKIIESLKNALGINSPSTETHEIGTNLIQGLVNGIKNGAALVWNTIKSLCSGIIDTFKNFDFAKISAAFWTVSAFLPTGKITNIIAAIANLVAVFGDELAESFSGIGKNVVDGLGNGIKNGASSILDIVGNIITGLVNFVKNLLGIHSPSKVFFVIGGFIISGLVGGLLSSNDNIKAALQTIGDTIINFFSGLDIQTVIAAGIAVGALVLVKQIKDILGKFADAAKGFGHLADTVAGTIETINGGVTGKIQPSKWTTISKAIERVAISITLLVASVVALTMVDKDRLWPAVGALATIAVIIAGLAALTALINKIPGASDIDKVFNTILKLTGAMALMVIVAKIAGGMSHSEMDKAAKIILGFSAVIAAFLVVNRLTSNVGEHVGKLGGVFVKMAIAMGLMIMVAKVAGGMSNEEMIRAGIVIAAFTAVMSVFMAMSKVVTKNEKDISGVGSALFKIAAAMAIMVIVAKVAGGMEYEEMVKAGIVIGAFIGVLTLLTVMTKLVAKENKNIDKIGGSLFKIAAAMGIMVIVAKIAGSMELDEMIKAGLVMGAFTVFIGALMLMTKLVAKENKHIDAIGGSLLKIAAAMGIMVIVAKLAGSMSLEEMAKGALAITYFTMIIGALMAMTRIIGDGENVKDIGKNLLMIAGAIGILAAITTVFYILAKDPDRLMTAVAALTIITTAFSLIVVASNYADGLKKGAVKQLALMLAVVAALGGIVAALGFIPNPEGAAQAAEGIAVLLLSLSASMAILQNTKGVTTDTIGKAALMGLVVAELGVILAVLSAFDVAPSIETALTLGVLINALAAAMLILSLAKGVDAKTVGIVAIMAVIVAALGAVIGVLEKYDLAPSIETALTLSTLLLAMSAALLILTPIGAMAAPALAGMGVLAAFIAALTRIIVRLGALMKIDGFAELVQDGGTVLGALGNAIGSFVGGIVGGFATNALAGLPEIGSYLSEFMTNANAFLVGINNITPAASEGAKNLCAAILALTVAELVDGIASLINSESSLPALGLELSQFMVNITPFLVGATMIKPEMVEGVKALAETIMILTKAEVLEGLSSKVFGTEGGLKTFGEQLPYLATGLQAFMTALNAGGKFDKTAVETVKCACDAVKTLAEAADTLPNEGGWIAKLVGENSIGTFGQQLPTLGAGLAMFVTALTKGVTFDENAVNAVKCACDAVKTLAEASTSIDGQAEWTKKLFGDNSLSAFGTQLGSLGSSLATFVKNLGTFSEEQVSTVKSAVSAIKALTGLASADLEGAKKYLPKFGNELSDFAKDLASFCKSMPATDVVNAATGNIKKILDTVSNIVDTKTEAIANFASSLKKLAKSGVDSFVKELTSSDAESATSDAGKNLVEWVIDGIESMDKDLKTAGTAAAEEAVDGMDDPTDEAESAGKDLGDGLVIGINSKKKAAYNAGYALGQAAVQGEKDGQQSNSPSKLTIQAGHWLGDGLVIGMAHMFKKVTKAGYTLGDSATQSISGSIATIASSIDSDMDMQPTIRPVVDLSDVKAGAEAVGGMFSANPSLGLLANVRSINSSMNRRVQNGANEEVVSAIKDLKKSINTKSGDTYHFGNFTYGEGTEVEDAVKQLVRAIRVERRT